MREKPRYDVQHIAEKERAFFAEYLKRAMYTTVPSSRSGGANTDEVAPLSAEDYAEAVKDVSVLHSGWKA